MGMIDANTLLRHKRKMSGADFGGEFWDEAVLVSDIMNASPVDVVEVVRCKDCKYWQDNNGGYPHEECRWGHGETPDANDFCSYGERKEGADKG